jgi:DNA primase
MRCWSVGLKTAVAPQGTSITEGQLALLRRYHPQVECLFDSDDAGRKAALRFLPLALKAGLETRFLVLAGESKLDPDLLFLERGLAAYEDMRRDSLSAMAYACRTMLPDPAAAGPEQKNRIARELFEIIAQAESDVVRAGFAQEAAGHLRVPPAALERDLRAHLARRSTPRDAARVPAAGAAAAPPASGSAKSIEEHLLYLCLHHEPLIPELAAHLPHHWIDTGNPSGRVLDRMLAEAQHNGWSGREQLNQVVESEEEKSLVASLLFDAPDLENLPKAVNEGLRHLQRRFLEPRLRQIELEIAGKATDGDADLLSLLKQRSEMTRQLLNPPTLSLVV